jgi:hypothetical protein
MSLIPVIDTTYVRDTNSRALINQDKSGLERYLAKRNRLAAQKEEINTIKSDITDIKGDITEIKQLMMTLIKKGSNG